MSLFTNNWRRVALSATTLVLFSLMLVVGANGSVASPQRVVITPTPGKPAEKPILLTDAVPNPKEAGVLWFAPTGHTLRGAFLDYWNKYGGLAQFGYPLTEEFFEPVGADNKLYKVQYFERNRFEAHPENAGTPYEVLLGTLGLDFRKADAPTSPISGVQYFQETGHNLSGTFKQYWETHGGLAEQGYPITEAQMERSTNGKEYLVQWSERSRLELHPENAGNPYEVLLGVLGRQLSEKKGYPYGWYPQYGNAVDYSWIAGQFSPPKKRCRDCQCDTIAYVQYASDTNQTRINPIGTVWDKVREYPTSTLLANARVVVFGHMATPTETKGKLCYRPGYIVDVFQTNPAR